MGNGISGFFQIFAQPPGGLIYHLVIILILSVVISFCIIRLRKTDEKQGAIHLLIGSAVLLFIQVLLVFFTHSNFSGSTQPNLILGIIERLAAALTITWFGWLFIDENKSFLFKGISIFLSIAFILFGGISISSLHLQTENLSTNVQWLFIFWEVISILLNLTGLILLISIQPTHWKLGGIFLAILTLAHFVQIFISDVQTPLMGVVRLAQLICIPGVYLLYREMDKAQALSSNAIPAAERLGVKLLVDTKPALVNDLLQVSLTHKTEEKFKIIARSIALGVTADMCCLVKMSPQQDIVQLVATYDLIREEYLPNASLKRDALQQIVSAWENNEPLTLSNSETLSKDGAALGEVFNYPRLGSLFAYPLSLPNQETMGGVILLSPYTNKFFGESTNQMMDTIKQPLTKVLFTTDPNEKLQQELQKIWAERNAFKYEKDQLTLTINNIDSALQEKEKELKQLKARYQIEKIESVEQIERLQKQLTILENQIGRSQQDSGGLEQLEAEIRQLTTERDHLQQTLAHTTARLKEAESREGQTGPIRLSVQSRIISLDSIAANVQVDLTPEMQQKNIHLDLINPNGRQLIKTDPDLINTILRGLLDNALAVTPPDGKIQLDQQLSFETGMLVIQVTDYGEGLTREEQKSLFSGEAPVISGVGSVQALRDAIRAIRLLNGKIWLRSKKHAFTTFRVQLPVRIID